MRRQLAAALLGAALLTGGAQAVAEPPAARYVADEADVLSSETEQYIIDKNQSLFENTGGEIVVVSVDFMDGMDAADYAMAVAESWGGIGDESLNNGFLLVYAVGENKVWAMAGSGIEDALPASKIEGWLEADFYGGYDAGEYDSATRAFFDDVYGWYESYYGTSAGTVVPSEPGRDFGYYPEPENDFVFAVVGQMGLFLLILLVVVVTIITFAFALVFAAILTREKIKGQNFFRIIFYIPNILSVVVISGIFSAIYKPENGMLNSIIGLFRDMTDPILWKGEKLVIPSIIIAMVWQAVGYYMVMYMASMSSVPASLYESANLDGAGRLTQFFQITIPLVWTNIRTTLTFFIISTINMAFLFVKAMTSGGPNGASDVALNYMYSQKDAGLYGYSMAIGVVIFLFSFALSACVNRATSREPLEF